MKFITVLALLVLADSALGWSTTPGSNNSNNNRVSNHETSRRRLIQTATAFPLALLLQTPTANAASVTTAEFGIILRDSARSVQRVEFSGPKGETVVVKLIDGTSFGISDAVESSTDPRSPLKIAALCRENSVQTKFLNLEAILANAPKKKLMYTNQRVIEAQEKEKERQVRMAKDEEDRLAALYKFEQDEAAR